MYRNAPVTFSVEVEHLVDPAPHWHKCGVMKIEGSIGAENQIVADVPCALYEFLKKHKKPGGGYRVGEAEFLYDDDDVSRIR